MFSLDELQILFLQEEAGKLRQALAAERSKNARLLQLLQHRLELHKRLATVPGGQCLLVIVHSFHPVLAGRREREKGRKWSV